MAEDAPSPELPGRRRRGGDPPARVAKIATAGASGAFVLGLTAVIGWAERAAHSPEPAIAPPAPPTTSIAPSTTEPTVVAVTTLAAQPTTAIAPAPTTTVAPAPPATVAPPPPVPPPPEPVIVVTEQSQ